MAAAAPVQAPDHPTKVDPILAVAIRLMIAPLENGAVQVLPHETPAGFDVIEPAPVPAGVTVKLTNGISVKVPREGEGGEAAFVSTAEPPPPQPENAKHKAKL